MSILTEYHNKVADSQFIADAAQEQIATRLDQFQQRINQHLNAPLFDRVRKKHPLPKHIYIWGEVGRGKTMLMDILYQQAGISKRRFHFATFMRWLHIKLSNKSGQKNPLHAIADDIADGIHLICFDEFQVIDIGDAMLLATFLERLLSHPISMCTTSNLPPSDLYKDGLQRSRFLPAIKLIENRFDILSLQTQQDYRRLQMEQTAYYLHPIQATHQQQFIRSFISLCAGNHSGAGNIEINGRSFAVLNQGSDAVCFDFDSLCRQPRSSADYVVISERYRIVFISGLVALHDKADSDAVRRFINLIDQLYDNNCFLACLAEVDIDHIYTDTFLSQPFKRCHSRLIEMQSKKYLQRCVDTHHLGKWSTMNNEAPEYPF